MRIKEILLASVLTTGALGLSGCSTFHQVDGNIHSTNSTVSGKLKHFNDQAGVHTVTTHTGPYLLGTMVKTPVSGKNDSVFNQHVTLDTSQPLSIGEFATQITQMTGVPVHVTNQVSSYLNGETHSGQQYLPGLPGQSGEIVAPSLPNQSRTNNRLNITWNGSLRGLLNLVASRTGTFWRFNNGTVQFFLTETQAFSINALPGTTKMTADITDAGTTGSASGASGTNGAGSTGSTNQSASLSSSLDVYKSIVEGVNTILAQTKSAGGSGTQLRVPTSVAANETTGQVVVTGTPPELQAVADYLKPINQQMSKNVLIDMHIYSVTLNKANNYGINLNAALQALGQHYGINLQGVAPPTFSSPNEAGSISAAILSPLKAFSNTSTPAQDWPDGLQSGTQGLVKALATQGNVSLVTDGSVIALNGQPTPLQVAQTKTYLASASTTNTVNVGSQSTLTPGQYTVGFSGTFLPLIRGRKILLEYTVDLSQDQGLRTITSNGESIEAPQIARQSFMQRVSIRPGQTLVLSGFEQTSDQDNKTGTGSPNFFLLGGGRSAQHQKQALVIVLHVEKLGS